MRAKQLAGTRTKRSSMPTMTVALPAPTCCMAAEVRPFARRWLCDLRHRDPSRGRRGQCFANAARLALRDDRFTYVEGYATLADGAPYLDHAWVVDSAGQVTDPTWTFVPNRFYFGVPLRTDALDQIAGLNGNRWQPSLHLVDAVCEAADRELLERFDRAEPVAGRPE